MTDLTFTRRDALRIGAAWLIQLQTIPPVLAADPQNYRKLSGRRKRVVVAGGGIGGLCCAYELAEFGHDVTVLEASGRTGGHVKNWAKDPWAPSCERHPYRLGTLRKFWPQMIEPVGRIDRIACVCVDLASRAARRES